MFDNARMLDLIERALDADRSVRSVALRRRSATTAAVSGSNARPRTEPTGIRSPRGHAVLPHAPAADRRPPRGPRRLTSAGCAASARSVPSHP